MPRPVLSTITGCNTTVCPGESFTLEASNVAGASYTWTLPDGTTSNDNPLTVATATQDHAGTYTVYASQRKLCKRYHYNNNECVSTTEYSHRSGKRHLYTRRCNTLIGNRKKRKLPMDTVRLHQQPEQCRDIYKRSTTRRLPYQVTAFDVNACLDSADYSFTILPNEVLEINNVITPNGDGKNDVWVIDFLENVDVYTISILSRNGAEVYRAENPYNNDWGGISDEGKELPSGAYFYIIDTKDKVYTGGLTIVK
ncbi:MAG: gliding motility-associated C-terminal domain-containing protein [Chitinophagales bacterium]